MKRMLHAQGFTWLRATGLLGITFMRLKRAKDRALISMAERITGSMGETQAKIN
jgi:hypothetical protein